MRCQQCGGAPFVSLKNGIILCLDCWYKVSTINSVQQRQLIDNMNYLIGAMEDTAGIPRGSLSRHPTPQSPTIVNQPVTNTIKIDGSIVGAVNTGYINQLNSSMSNISQINQTGAEKVKKFATAVIEETKLSTQDKNNIIEQLNFLTQQLSLKKENRSNTIIKIVLGVIKKTVSFSADLAQLYLAVHELFGIF